MKSWSQTEAPRTNNTKEIERIKLGNTTSIRLVGNILPRYVYWVVTNEGKRRPIECLHFDRDSESFVDTSLDPMKEVSKDVFDERPQFAYVCNSIDRSDEHMKLFDLKKTIYDQIKKYAKDPDWGNPADEKNGYDITITREKTGPKTQNVKYTCTPSRSSTPLTEEEKELTLYNLETIMKRPTYQEQKEWLIQNTTYFLDLTNQDLAVDENVEDL